MKTINENGIFPENALQRGTFWKRCLSRVRVDRRKRNFSKTLRTHNQFQFTPRNIINLFKMPDGLFPFLSLIRGVISNLIACFQADLALLILQADYSRRRQNIITLLSLPVSRGKVGSLLSLTSFLPWFWHFKLFLRLWRTSQCKPTPKKFNFLFRGLIIANTYESSMRSRVSYCFQIDSSCTCGRAKTIRKRYEWALMFLKTEKESCVFKRIRIRVDRASFIGVPSRCIKLAYPFICEALTTIYNPSLQQGTVPDILNIKNNPNRQGGLRNRPCEFLYQFFLKNLKNWYSSNLVTT